MSEESREGTGRTPLLSRRSLVRGSLIGLGAALLVQPQGGVADENPRKDDSKTNKTRKTHKAKNGVRTQKEGGKIKPDTPKKDGG